MIEKFCEWLATTKPSLVVQNVLWLIPFFQGIHILAIGIIATSIAVIDARLIGIGSRPLPELERRFMPWIWSAFVVLLLSGLVLVFGEPKRELMNYLFRIKMLLVVVLLGLALLVQMTVKQSDVYWQASAGRALGAKAIGAGSILILLAVVACGRWIAYAGMIGGAQ
jgi:uncharacterized membrane protein